MKELKQIPHVKDPKKVAAFNRTMKELKRVETLGIKKTAISFNRTMKELKPHPVPIEHLS